MVEPILMSIATTLATKAAGSLTDLVRSAFGRHPKAAEALDAAENAEHKDAASPEVTALASELGAIADADPEFARKLHAEWARVETTQRADRGGVNNLITGNVSGKVLQARDIQGNINL